MRARGGEVGAEGAAPGGGSRCGAESPAAAAPLCTFIYHAAAGKGSARACTRLTNGRPAFLTRRSAAPHRETAHQSTSPRPASRSAWSMRENGRLPKKPRLAERGDGCAERMTTWRSASISDSFFPA